MKKQHKLLLEDTATWNVFRSSNPNVQPDLRGGKFFRKRFVGLNLSECRFDKADVGRAEFIGSDLSGSVFESARMNDVELGASGFLSKRDRAEFLNRRGASFRWAMMTHARLRQADLTGANFHGAHMPGAFFEDSVLVGADFSATNLRGAHFEGADLTGARFSSCNLEQANFARAKAGATVFDNVDLSVAWGLEEINFTAPCAVSISAIYRSAGQFSKDFMRNAHPDISDQFLLELETSLRKTPFDYRSCFLSYAHRDEDFAKKLHRRLHRSGVQCWMDAQNLGSGVNFSERIRDAIARYDKFLIVLSNNSLRREWIRNEIAWAREYKENDICPIRLDDQVDPAEFFQLDPRSHIADFREWERKGKFEVQLRLLLTELRR